MSTDAKTVKVTQEIDAPAEHVWGMVADVTRMGEWSPENESARWSQDPGGPTPWREVQGH